MFFTPNYLHLSTQCNLRCMYCTVWKQPLFFHFPKTNSVFAKYSLDDVLRPEVFFKQYSRKRPFYLFGGDPLCFPDLERVLVFLKRYRCSVSLWTNGDWPMEWILALKTYIQHLYLYCPASLADAYRLATGTDRYTHLFDVIREFRSTGIPVSLYTMVTPENFGYLPDIREIAIQHRLELVLTYDPSLFDKDQVAAIKRFNRVKPVRVFQLRCPVPGSCPAVPVLDSIGDRVLRFCKSISKNALTLLSLNR